ncbi:hypothetical protein QA640_14380 [Bradyrhizobium sp. CB82]|nr:hypothetical protein [Bradyrhizobium sp. CB82]WFU43526.1 hypothetical protein QA640_14380 [Bradyrhizobium sp. CB82]
MATTSIVTSRSALPTAEHDCRGRHLSRAGWKPFIAPQHEGERS